MKYWLPCLMGLFVWAGSQSSGGEARRSAEEPRVFCMNRQGLREAKVRIGRNDPLLQPSLRRLLQQADKALEAGPFSVMQKSKVPPSGDKHDYMSIGPYAWPDPGKKDGLPYINRDGQVNPQWWRDYDRVPLERLTQATETLALAYYFSDKELYARRAAHLLRVWFLDPATRMTPDLKYAQAVPGRHEGGPGVIDTRFMSRLVDTVGLLETSEAWTDGDQDGMVNWWREFLKNQRSRADRQNKDSGHNIPTWYHVQTAAEALFVGDDELARELIGRTKKRIEKAIGPDGVFVPERGRTRSLSYSCFHLYAMFNLATMGEYVDVDLWHFETPDGRGLRRAIDFLAQYAGPDRKKNWPYQEIARAKEDWWDPYRDQLPCVLYRAAKVYRDDRHEARAAEILERDLPVSRLQLMCGIPIRWWDTVNLDFE